jgi:hypothetical protein
VESDNKSPGLLGKVRDVAFIAAVYVFLSGFTYRHYYLHYYGITTPFDTSEIAGTMVYAYSAFDFAMRRLIIVLLIALVGFFVVKRFWSKLPYSSVIEQKVDAFRKSTTPSRSVSIWAVAALVSFPIVAHISATAGESDAEYVRKHPHGVDFHATVRISDAASQKYDAAVRSVLESGNLRIIAESADTFFLLEQNGTQLDRHGFVHGVHKDDVAAFSILLPGKDH